MSCLSVLALALLVQLAPGQHQIQGAQASNLAMNLPDGIENILGFVPKSTFKCERDGYFGDIDNDCKIFHLCQRNTSPGAGAKTEWRHWTYACGNQTMFNQLTLTCAFVDEAIPCQHSSQFQYLNEVIHKPAEPFLTDADVTSGVSYYSNRIMSDGARARAFQDSQLLAQIGGGLAASNKQQDQQQQAASASSPLSSSALLETDNSANEARGSQEATSSRFFESNLAPSSLQNTFQPTNRLGSRDFSSASQSSASLVDNFQAATSSPPPANSFVGQQQKHRQSQAQHFSQPASSSPNRAQADSSRRQAHESTSGATSQNLQPFSRQQADLIENHAWHFQHQPVQVQNQQPQHQFVFSEPWQQTWQQPQQPQSQQQGQPQAAPSDAWQQFSSAQVDGSRDQSTVSSGAQPNSFQFSLSTNHANSGSPFNTFASSTSSSDPTNESRQQQQQPQFATQPSNTHANNDQVDLRGPATTGASLAPSTAAPFPSAATLAATTQPQQLQASTTQPSIEPAQQSQQPTTTTTTAAATTTSNTLTTSSGDSGPLPSSTLASSFAFSSGQPLQLAQPTQATPSTLIGATSSTASAPTTTTTTATAATSSPVQVSTTSASTSTTPPSTSGGAGHSRRAASSSGGRRQQQQGAANRRTNDLSGFDRSHVGFQSERLSAVNRRMAAANTADTPLVMRRNPSRASSSAASSQLQQQTNQQNNRANNNRLQQQQQQQQPASGSSAGSAGANSALLASAGDTFHLQPSSLAGSDFWRRSFDSQLMAPRFESILLRRRV